MVRMHKQNLISILYQVLVSSGMHSQAHEIDLA